MTVAANAAITVLLMVKTNMALGDGCEGFSHCISDHRFVLKTIRWQQRAQTSKQLQRSSGMPKCWIATLEIHVSSLE